MLYNQVVTCYRLAIPVFPHETKFVIIPFILLTRVLMPDKWGLLCTFSRCSIACYTAVHEYNTVGRVSSSIHVRSKFYTVFTSKIVCLVSTDETKIIVQLNQHHSETMFLMQSQLFLQVLELKVSSNSLQPTNFMVQCESQSLCIYWFLSVIGFGDKVAEFTCTSVFLLFCLK